MDLMFKLFVNNRFNILIFSMKRSAVVLSNGDLGDRMKVLNDNKQFEKVIKLFYEYTENNTIEQCSNWIIIQTLKACTQLGDLKRGMDIHQQVSHRLKHDSYIVPSLIHLYSKCIHYS